MNLQKRIEELVRSEWKEVCFTERELLSWVAKRIGPFRIKGSKQLAAKAVRNILHGMRDAKGRKFLDFYGRKPRVTARPGEEG